MITKLYANNFRCLVAFEARLDSFGVLCGPNGAGKSSVFDAIKLIRDLCTGKIILGGPGEDDIKQLEFTKWMNSTTQEFELSVNIDGRYFEYKLHIEQTHDTEKPRIVLENLTIDARHLFTRNLDGVTFARPDGTQGSFPLDWRQSALANIQPSGALRDVEILQNMLADITILRPNPHAMNVESKSEIRSPNLEMGNIISWYRYLSQDQKWSHLLRESLQEVWPDFNWFKLVDAGMTTKLLQLCFDDANNAAKGSYFFHQLSDGEKILIGLYMVRAALETGAVKIVLVDEPDNYVGLPELQPWVLAVRELLDEQHQAILISHHPEILGYAGEEFGNYLWRDNHTSPTRMGPLSIPEGLSAGEAIARGWINGE